jgi:hypothetical protein
MHKGKSLKIAVVHLETKHFSYGPLHVPSSRGGTAYQLCVRTPTEHTRNTVYQEDLYKTHPDSIRQLIMNDVQKVKQQTRFVVLYWILISMIFLFVN